MYYGYETVEFYLLMGWMLLNGWHFLVFRRVWVQISYKAAYPE